MPATFENLEPRRMMSATLKSGVLRVVGTAADDVIAVQLERGKYLVRTNGRRDGAFTAGAVTWIQIDGGAGDDHVSVAANVNRRARLIGGAGDDVLLGGPREDTLDGGAGDDVLRGRGGNDRCAPGAGDNAVDGGAGADTIDYANLPAGVSADLADGTIDHYGPEKHVDAVRAVEIFNGSEGSDDVWGGRATLAVYGNGGDDYLSLPRGCAASLFGGAGDDDLQGTRDATNLLDGGTGTDTIDYSWYYSVYVHVSLDDVANDGVAGERDQVLDCENVRGGSDGSTIIGNAADNVLSGSTSNDVIHGGGGNDTLSGSWGYDSLDGGAGDDLIYGGLHNDTLVGGAGHDTLHGEEGDDVFLARDGARDLGYGGDGNDRALMDGPSGNGPLGNVTLGDLVRDVETLSEIAI